MNNKISNLLLYKDIKNNRVLNNIAEIIEELNAKNYSIESSTSSLYDSVYEMLEVANYFNLDGDLWKNYIAYLIITDENLFSLSCERKAIAEGSLSSFAKNDFEMINSLFEYDFNIIELKLNTSIFKSLKNYNSVSLIKSEAIVEASKKIRLLSKTLSTTNNTDQLYDIISNFYNRYGVGTFCLNSSFSLDEDMTLSPIHDICSVSLDDLVGYESQKQRLLDNTEAFLKGYGANNVLLFGDSGTGKSTSIKAISNSYANEGLRIIEIYKHQLKDLSSIISTIRDRNYKFIIYMDDLSFEEFETEYKYLKATIEGSLEAKPDNILIYATSNRRHLIKEVWSDRDDIELKNEVHRSDTLEEKLSLVHRFGITIGYYSPNKKEFNNIVRLLAKKNDIEIDDEQLFLEANMWEMNHGGLSGRTAQQFINYLKSRENV